MRGATATVAAISGASVAAAFAALALGGGLRTDARVVCHDPERGHLSADMPMVNATRTPAGWVLYFPNDRIGPRVQVWAECEVRQ